MCSPINESMLVPERQFVPSPPAFPLLFFPSHVTQPAGSLWGPWRTSGLSPVAPRSDTAASLLPPSPSARSWPGPLRPAADPQPRPEPGLGDGDPPALLTKHGLRFVQTSTLLLFAEACSYPPQWQLDSLRLSSPPLPVWAASLCLISVVWNKQQQLSNLIRSLGWKAGDNESNETGK